MFQFFRKNKEQENREIQIKIKKEVEEIADKTRTETVHIVQEEFNKLSKRLHKQSSMLEDILETTQEYQQEKSRLEADISWREQQEEQLIFLIMKYQEYLELISDYLMKDRNAFPNNESENMDAQIKLVSDELENLRKKNGVEIVDKEGGKVDTSLHKIIETKGTDNMIMNGTVNRVLVPGIIYRGKVIQKAKITAFVYKNVDENS